CSLRRPPNATPLFGAMATCQGSAPPSSSATFSIFGVEPSSGNVVLKTLTVLTSRLTATTTLSSAEIAIGEPRLGPGAMLSGPFGSAAPPSGASPVGGRLSGFLAGSLASPPPHPVSLEREIAAVAIAEASGKMVRFEVQRGIRDVLHG